MTAPTYRVLVLIHCTRNKTRDCFIYGQASLSRPINVRLLVHRQRMFVEVASAYADWLLLFQPEFMCLFCVPQSQYAKQQRNGVFAQFYTAGLSEMRSSSNGNSGHDRLMIYQRQFAKEKCWGIWEIPSRYFFPRSYKWRTLSYSDRLIFSRQKANLLVLF